MVRRRAGFGAGGSLCLLEPSRSDFFFFWCLDGAVAQNTKVVPTSLSVTTF